ncbi:hypothetical protein [Mycolicibacterium bacteremicum]|uniref:hypothetical protein n=1 Tax=Mycolicibacterium bacteremicum TaxID=564198 RepID=UPI0026E9B5E1|nr:hypothetical protein [Mycolicibacterium bacteremicum]
MRKATSKIGANVGAAAGAAALLAGAALAFGPATANAEPEGQLVRYTLATGAPYQFQVFYLTAQPPSMDAYNADAYAYAKRETITVSPGAPWVFETTLADPQWAILQVSSTTKGSVGPPNAHCDIAVGDQVIAAADNPYSVTCQGTQW